jgi:hypothetical protein
MSEIALVAAGCGSAQKVCAPLRTLAFWANCSPTDGAHVISPRMLLCCCCMSAPFGILAGCGSACARVVIGCACGALALVLGGMRGSRRLGGRAAVGGLLRGELRSLVLGEPPRDGRSLGRSQDRVVGGSAPRPGVCARGVSSTSHSRCSVSGARGSAASAARSSLVRRSSKAGSLLRPPDVCAMAAGERGCRGSSPSGALSGGTDGSALAANSASTLG